MSGEWTTWRPGWLGGIVLCGGLSRRMGRPKTTLPFGDQTMIERVVAQLQTVVEHVVVVAAAGQSLPPWPSHQPRVVHDRRPERGPLEGLAAGLAALPTSVAAAYVTSCDVPLLRAEWIRALAEQLEDFDAVVPKDDQFVHPLAAIYRTSVLPEVERLLAQDQLRPTFVLERVRTRWVPVEQLQHADPQFESLMNVNHPDDYRRALRHAGLAEPDWLSEL